MVICIQKYNNYSSMAYSGELKNLFNDLSNSEKTHFNTLNDILSGKQPNLSSNSSTQSSQPCNSKTTYSTVELKKQDEYLEMFVKLQLEMLSNNVPLLNRVKENKNLPLLTSCCPGWIDYIEKNYPKMVEHISHNLSPMAELGRYIKKTDPTAKVIFISSAHFISSSFIC